VLGVLGENGAGKTTLLSTLSGLVRPDAGVIEIDGTAARISSPREAWRLGIGMVHQHFALVEPMTVLENLALGRRRGGGFRLDLDELRREATELGERVGLDVPLGARVEDLGVGDRQRAEVLKVLLRDPAVLVLDEPTAVLAPSEVDGLLGLLRRLADDGRAILLVAHKLDEVLAIADRVTVLRGGRTVLEARRAEVDARAIAVAMVGTEPAVLAARGVTAGDRKTVAHLRGVELDAADGCVPLRGIDLRVEAGEIVGVAGVEGNGQRELALVLSGRLNPDRGEVTLADDPAFVPQDRRREGLIASFTLAENLAVGLHRDEAYQAGPLLRWGRIRQTTRAAMKAFSIRAPGPGALASSLSGGNQQRLVVARELEGRPALIVAENPTRGLDVAGAAFVHRTLRERSEGPDPAGVVLVSTDLDEILGLSDRVVVLVRGRVIAVPESERSREGIGARMLEGVE
jgi:simple sugar transport system ATP-binding protein